MKRHGVPGVELHWLCPTCGRKNVRDFCDNYLSFPTTEMPFDEELTCESDECPDAYVRLILRQSLELV